MLREFFKLNHPEPEQARAKAKQCMDRLGGKELLCRMSTRLVARGSNTVFIEEVDKKQCLGRYALAIYWKKEGDADPPQRRDLKGLKIEVFSDGTTSVLFTSSCEWVSLKVAYARQEYYGVSIEKNPVTMGLEENVEVGLANAKEAIEQIIPGGRLLFRGA